MRIRFALVVAAGMALTLGLGASENSPEASEETPSSVWDGIYTLEQAERGEPLYTRGCGECHGPDLGGDDMSPPLIGSDFVWDWNGLTVGDLFERLRISMPDGKPRSMTNQEKADVLAFMLLKNDFPAGDSELASSTRALSPIAFEAVKP
jgi:mono/diheme cytochrome c family protein